MVPLTGYSNRLSVEPGGTIEFKISSTASAPYRARLVRIIHGDPNPAGPGYKYEDVPAEFEGDYPSRLQTTSLGSYGRVEHGDTFPPLGAVTLSALIWPTLPAKGVQGILSKCDPQTGTGVVLGLGADGVFAQVGQGDGNFFRLATGTPLRDRVWYCVWASYDPTSGAVRVGQLPLRPAYGIDDHVVVAGRLDQARLDAAAPILIGALGEPAAGHFNGKIEDPMLLKTAIADGHQALALDPLSPSPDLIAGWDFSRGISGLQIEDVGPHRLHGVLVNLPTRAVKGARWSGQEMCWRHAPREYAAIHFHEDDLYDCGWETDFTFRAPDDLRSGVYGVRLSCDSAEDTIPFYVRPKRGRPTAPILFLASTFTYQAYANHARGNYDDAYQERASSWGAYPWNPDAHPEYGRSTYNFHPDRSGTAYSSRLRPILTMRPGFLTFVDKRGSGLRHFPADTHLLDWLEAKGFAYDVVTDEDLDDVGPDLIARYKVVLTGSHPEYHTPGTLDALQHYVDNGGRLVYLGGNGFYWRIARNPDVPGAIEVRRAEGGIRAWAAEPGEYYHSLDGQYGGLWRRNDRPPQQLAGVGFSAQGLFDGSYYRRLPASNDPRAAWIFEGIGDERLGDFGLSGGGAAGFELDRADVRLGTPRHALVLASSEGHGPSFIGVPEELLSHIATWTGEPPNRLIRGELVFFETPKGGAVFSVGSITFCGSLSYNGYDNNISRILHNVVSRFRE